MKNKFEITFYYEGGKGYYEIRKKDEPTLVIEEQILAEMIYTLFAEGEEKMIQFLKREGVYED